MRRLFLITVSLLFFVTGHAQNWTLKDAGVGLIIEDENYDKQLKIVQKGTTWDVKELFENGAQAGKYKGNQLFAAWLKGPDTKLYLNKYGTPVWMYKYTITYPDGKTFDSGNQGFYAPGFACFGIKTGSYKEGVWKIEWFIVNRDNQQTNLVATTVFNTTWGAKSQ